MLPRRNSPNVIWMIPLSTRHNAASTRMSAVATPSLASFMVNAANTNTVDARGTSLGRRGAPTRTAVMWPNSAAANAARTAASVAACSRWPNAISPSGSISASSTNAEVTPLAISRATSPKVKVEGVSSATCSDMPFRALPPCFWQTGEVYRLMRRSAVRRAALDASRHYAPFSRHTAHRAVMPSLIIKVLSQNDEPLAETLEAEFDHEGGTIGRGTGSTLLLPDPTRQISRTHAVIDCTDGRYRVTNRGSVIPV